MYPGDIRADVINSPDIARGGRVLIGGAVHPGNIRADVINSPDIARGSRVLIDGAVYPGDISADVIGFLLDPEELSTTICHWMRAARCVAL